MYWLDRIAQIYHVYDELTDHRESPFYIFNHVKVTIRIKARGSIVGSSEFATSPIGVWQIVGNTPDTSSIKIHVEPFRPGE